MTFENGWTVSVQWHNLAYCERKGQFSSDDQWSSEDHNPATSKDAEIAAWDKNGIWYEFEHDTVKGYCTAEEVLDFMNTIRNL
jgi:hypothetical protein